MKKQLHADIENILERFPSFLDKRLIEGVERMFVTTPSYFIAQRREAHLRRVLLFQFLLQKNIESQIQNGTPTIKAKLFLSSSQLCLIAVVPFVEKKRVVDQECLVKTLQKLAPSMSEVPGSFWRWLHPELPYMGIYIEMQRLRGRAFTRHELHSLQNNLEKELLLFLSEAPLSLFWPFNVEEICKQLCILQSELHSPEDLAQVTIHFREQTTHLLEFVINLARPFHPIAVEQKAASLLPQFVIVCMHFVRKIDTPFAKEDICFSLFLPTHHFIEHHTINLLRAREQIAHYVQLLVGPFRDYNGGLLEMQKRTFADISAALADKIPLFSLFANQAFHSLQPVEARFTLPLQEMEQMLRALSNLIHQPDKERYITEDATIAVFKTRNPMELQPLFLQAKQNKLVFTEFDLDSMRYFCVRDLQKQLSFSPKKNQTLRLMFLEEQPPSLSPYLSGGDIRCCTIGKLLFEGLTRIDATGLPKPAGAESIHVSEDGKHYTFQLRPSHWSNGKPVTSMDYLIGWRKVLKREWISNRPDLLFVIKNGKRLYQQVCHEQDLGLHAPTPTILQIELEYPDPYFLEKLAHPLFFPSLDGSQEPSCFNGPYILKRYTQKDLDLEINPAFWDAKNIHLKQIQIGSGTIEEIHLHFRNGKIDWIGNPFGALSSDLMLAFEKEGILHKQPVKRHFFVYLNTKHPLLRSPLIRRALSLALDRSFICAHIFPNCTPLHTLFPETREVSENITEAQLLFQKGLDTLESNQPITPLVIHYAQLPGHEKFAPYLQKVWSNAFGLTIHIHGQPWNLYRNTLEKKSFQIAGYFASEMAFDSFELLHSFDEANRCTNFSHWHHPVYSSRLNASYSASREKRLQLLQEASFIFTQETPMIPVGTQSFYFAKNHKLQGEVINAFGHVDFRFAFKKE